MRRPARHTGYVLVLALAILVIAGSVLGLLARQSMTKAAAARRLAHDVQLRWGHITLRDALLPTNMSRFKALQREAMAEHDRLRAAGKSPPPPTVPRTIRLELPLGGLHFAVVLRDENARANVNTVYRQRNRNLGTTTRAISFALLRSGGSADLRLAPNRDADNTRFEQAQEFPLRAFTSFGQVFDAGPADLMGRDIDDTGLVGDLSCWGSGQVNVITASPTALRVVLSKYLTDNQLQTVRAEWALNTKRSMRQMIGGAVTPTERAAVLDLTTDASDCYSVWIAAGPADTGTHWWDIREYDDDGHRDLEFAW